MEKQAEHASKEQIPKETVVNGLKREVDGDAAEQEQDSKKRKGAGPKQAWSNQIEAKERKEHRREKKARKRAYLKAQLEAEEAARAGVATQGGGGSTAPAGLGQTGGQQDGADEDDDDGDDDAEDLAADKRASKRMKQERRNDIRMDFAADDL